MKKEEKQSAEQFVYQKVEEALYKRRLAPGTALTEQSLCDALGVGRTPVRGALRRLAENGFVELIANRGAFVVQAGAEQMVQLYEVRSLLEIYALKTCLDSYTEADFEYLQMCILQEKEAFQSKQLKTYLNAVKDFHMYIVHKNGNPYLEKSFQQVLDQITIYLILYDRFYIGGKDKLHSLSIHKRILAAIREKNLRKIEKAVNELGKKTIEGLDFASTSGANVGIALLD